MTNPDMMTNMVKQGIGGFLPQVPHIPLLWMPLHLITFSPMLLTCWH